MLVLGDVAECAVVGGVVGQVENLEYVVEPHQWFIPGKGDKNNLTFSITITF